MAHHPKGVPSASHVPEKGHEGAGAVDTAGPDRPPSREAVARSDHGAKPYTSEHEAYSDRSVQPPTHPDQRRDGEAKSGEAKSGLGARADAEARRDATRS